MLLVPRRHTTPPCSYIWFRQFRLLGSVEPRSINVAAGKLAGGAAAQPGSQPPPRPPGAGGAAAQGAAAGQLPGAATQPEAGSRPQTPAASAAAGATPPPVRKMEKPIEVRAGAPSPG